jgi:hypothetical protein
MFLGLIAQTISPKFSLLWMIWSTTSIPFSGINSVLEDINSVSHMVWETLD